MKRASPMVQTPLPLPPVNGEPYVPGVHTYETLRPASLGVSYDDPRKPVLVPMAYEEHA